MPSTTARLAFSSEVVTTAGTRRAHRRAASEHVIGDQSVPSLSTAAAAATRVRVNA